MPPTDQDLVRRAKQGDTDAKAVIVERASPRLYRLAMILTSRHHDAQDLVQETLADALQALGSFEERASLHTWLAAILHRKVALFFRKAYRRNSISLDAAGDVPDRQADHTRAVDARLDLAVLLARLDPDHRQVLVLREIESLSYDQIAQLLDIPRGTVESRLFRARRQLRDLLQPPSAPDNASANDPSAEPR